MKGELTSAHRATGVTRPRDRRRLATRRPPVELSVVVPVHNEDENIAPLVHEIAAALEGVVDYEIVYVDDGSTDDSSARLAEAVDGCDRLRVVRHARSSGQSAAIHTGVRLARGRWIATLDGDGQDDPADVDRLLRVRLDPPTNGRPVLVVGWRRGRRDTLLKRLSSRVANAVRRRLLGDKAPDAGCGLKLFRRDTFLALPYFDHMHRFLPALVTRSGGEVISVPVNHRPRRHGHSHYGIHNRLWVGIVDLFGVLWLTRRAKRPHAVETTPVRQESSR